MNKTQLKWACLFGILIVSKATRLSEIERSKLLWSNILEIRIEYNNKIHDVVTGQLISGPKVCKTCAKIILGVNHLQFFRTKLQSL